VLIGWPESFEARQKRQRAAGDLIHADTSSGHLSTLSPEVGVEESGIAQCDLRALAGQLRERLIVAAAQVV